MLNWGGKCRGKGGAFISFVFLFQIFMKPDFALEDSLTFNAVLPWSHFSTAGGKGNRDAASSKLLQEKVQVWYKMLLSIAGVSYCKQTPLLLFCTVCGDICHGLCYLSFYIRLQIVRKQCRKHLTERGLFPPAK